MGKTGRKNKVYSAEFKISVIMDMRELMQHRYSTLTKVGSTNTPNTNAYCQNITLHKVCLAKVIVWTTGLWKTSLAD